jgi:hypothetical protein
VRSVKGKGPCAKDGFAGAKAHARYVLLAARLKSGPVTKLPKARIFPTLWISTFVTSGAKAQVHTALLVAQLKPRPFKARLGGASKRFIFHCAPVIYPAPFIFHRQPMMAILF